MRYGGIMCALLLVGILTFLFATPLLAAEARYVGYKVCAACHKYQKVPWETTKHYRASDAVEQKRDRQCMPCHGTGALQGNFGEKWEKVQCEACHGPGKLYVKLMRRWKGDPEGKRKLTLEHGFLRQKKWVCLRCHGQGRPGGHVKIFNYKKAYEKVAHIKKKD